MKQLREALGYQGPLMANWAVMPQGPRVLLVPKVGSSSLGQLQLHQDQRGPDYAAFVRHPVDRTLSAWRHKICAQNQYQTGYVPLERLTEVLVETPDAELDHHLRAQSAIWSEILGTDPLPLYRFEDFEMRLSQWGVPRVPHLNQSEGPTSTSLGIRQALEERFREDLEAWRGAI